MFKVLKTHKFSKSATKVFENKDLLNIILDYADEIKPKQQLKHSRIMRLFDNSHDLRLDLTSTSCYLDINSFLLNNAFYKCFFCFNYYRGSHKRLWSDRNSNIRLNNRVCKTCFASFIM